MSALIATDLRVNGLADPLGVDGQPRLSWRLLPIDGEEAPLIAAQVQVFEEEAERPHWDTGRAVGVDSVDLPYIGPPLASASSYRWRVRCWNDAGDPGPWSEPGRWGTGLGDGWRAGWIRAPLPETAADPDGLEPELPAPVFRQEFELAAVPRRGRAYVTALGLYELRLNGAKVGEEELTPGWTDYRRRLPYQVFDVTELLQEGRNAVAIVLGDGWYCGRVGFFGRALYGDQPAALAQLEIETVAGGKVTVATGDGWRTHTSGIVANDLQLGESFDARAWPSGCDRPGFDDSGWSAAVRQASPGVALTAAVDAGTGSFAELEPVDSRWLGDRLILDFGQNLAGRVRLELDAEAGDELTLRHAEALTAEGELFLGNLGEAKQTDRFVAIAGRQRFEPRFTYHGFRYAELSGPRRVLEGTRATAVAISARLEQSGEFSCSNPMLNQLQSNIRWSQLGNFVSVPTDCPQRDERLGWSCDAQVFAATAAFNANVLPFFRKWLLDLEDAQLPSGAYPDVAPDPTRFGAGNAGWGDAGILVPWCLFVRYGARDLLERHYESMKRHLSFLREDSTGGVRWAGRYGDWFGLEPTPREVIGTAYLARCAEVLGQVAAALGDAAGGRECSGLRAEAATAFAERFLAEDGRVGGGSQTAQALALQFGLVPEPLRPAAARRLAGSIESGDGQLSTGFVGTPLVLPALSDHGHHELACRLAERTDYPSWGFQVVSGATTIWETWDAWTPEKGFQKMGRNSFNHYAFGAVGEWLYRYLGGLQPDPAAPGYGRARIDPRPGGSIDSARLAYESVRGRWEVAWEAADGVTRIELTVPPGASADVVLDGGGPRRVGAGRFSFERLAP